MTLNLSSFSFSLWYYKVQSDYSLNFEWAGDMWEETVYEKQLQWPTLPGHPHRDKGKQLIFYSVLFAEL